MSFNDEYLALRKKRQKEEEENKASFAPVRPLYVNKTAPLYVQDEDIAPVLTTTTKKDKDEDEKEERTFFKKGAFEDGYQFGDVAKTILGTGEDIKTNVGKGALKLVGGVADAVTYGVAGAADALEFDSFADKARKFAKKDIVDNVYKDQEEKIERYSVLGEKSDAVAEGLGQVGTIILTGGAAGALGVSATAATTVLTGASGIGSGMTEAYKGGATDEEAATYGVINGIVQAGSELIFGGLGKAVKAVGLSKGLTSIDDAFAQKLTEKITNRVVKNFVEYGVKASAEGAEEVIAGIGSAVGQKLTYMSDKELGELVKNQDLLEQFVIGSITSGIAQGYGLASSIGSDRDFITGLSANEQKVVDKEVENRVAEEEKEGKKLSNREKDKIREAVISDMEKGYISIDTIQEVLGGDTYKSYKDTTDSEEAILKEYEELGKKQNATLAEQDRFAELKAKIKEMQEGSQRNKLKSQLDDEVFGLVKKDRLVESYNERTKRGQAFAADVSKYDAKQQAIIQKAIDSGILNNTRRTHEFVDMIAKVSADKGVPFDFTNNERLKESGFAKDGKIVNGYVTKDGIVLNANSAKALNSVVGHEITHVLEGTELYGELQSVVAEYAKTKGEYQSRYDALAELYKDEDADIDAELTADLVGDYLFTDQDFVNNLSVKNRNVFQKVYDEIKYLCKVATAGSKEARDLEKVKRVFEKAYRDSGKAQEEQKFSLSDNAGKQLTAEQQEYFKDSKVRDKDGNLMVMYHGSQNAGFHVFDQRFSDDDTSFFFVDRNDVAATYSGTSEIYEAKSFRTAEDANKFFAEIGKPYYEVVEENGKFIFTENGDFIAESDTARGIYEEFCEWEGVGYGDANYKVYLNLKNPLVVDAKGRKWDELPGVNDDTQYEYIKIVDVGHLSGQVTIEYAINSDSAPVTETVDLYDKFPDNLADTLSDLSPGEGIKGIYVNPSTTREYSLHAKEQGYDGVIFNNIVDVGGYGNGNEGAATVAIAFNSNQIKSVANKKPTEDADIRYSLSKTDSKGRELSLAVQKWSGSSKVVDEDGDLKSVYHGTATGAFTIFDKTKGSVEGDYGSGFYFTDNEADVEEHYEGGGPDFDNKVGRRADEILNEEEGIEYEEAERRAREELFKGAHKFEVYLNIENPAIVGETMLFDPEGYLENYDEEDYEDYDDYIADVEQIVADDIDNIVWEVGRNVDVNDTDGISEVLWNAYADGGIGLEDLKARINELYLEDSEGNFVGNEVARQIIESLGYDGIIDPTVSGKWNMDIEEGTTHYIVFKPNQIKAVTNENPTDNPDIHFSISRLGSRPKHYGGWNVTGKDIALETAPVQESAPVAETAPVQTEAALTAEDVDAMLPDDLAPMPEMGNREALDSISDMDAPSETEAPYYESEEVTVDDPFEQRDIDDVGNRKVKAYMYENPEVKPFFQSEARIMLGELQNTVKGERWYNDAVYYESGGEAGWSGTKRHTSDDIAYLLDELGYTYKEIEKGLNAIIEDDGRENNACSKRIEFILNDRLKDGYTEFMTGMDVPADQDYVNLLNEKQITEYYRDIPFSDSDVPPVGGMEDIAPTPTAPKTVLEEQQEVWTEAKAEAERKVHEGEKEAAHIAEVLDEEPNTNSKRNKRAWAKFKAAVLDKGAVFEDLSLKTKNRELIAKWNYTLSSEARAQRFMGNGGNNAKSLNAIREEVGGKTKQFSEYMYHLLNIDRMSLDTAENIAKRAELRNQHFQGLTDKEIEATAMEWITKDTSKEHEARVRAAREYVDANQTKNKPVFGDEVTADISRQKVKEYEAAYPKFKEYAEDVYAYMNELRKQLVDNGVISQETADLWATMYPHYVPIRRKGDEGLAVNVPLDSKKTGVNAPIKRATGGNRDILPMFDTMGQRTIQTFKAIAKNSFGVELMNSLDSVVADEVSSMDEVMESIDAQEGLLQEGKDGNNPTFTVFEDGKRVTFEITEDMYDALKPVSEGMAYTNRAAHTISNIRRGLLTEYNPVFMLTNAIKDVQDVLINSQHPARTYLKIPEAFASMVSKGYWYNEYLDNGGENNTYFDKETNTFTKDTGLAKLLNSPPFSTVSALNNFIERIPRLAEYIASREAGRSVETSMLDAARVTTNFAAGGDLTKFLNRNGATFLNASVQGFNQQVRNFREAHANGARGYANLAVKFALAGVPVLILNSLVWDDDDDYEELSEYVKQNYYIVGKTDDGTFIRIPKGRTMAVIQHGIEQISNLATGNDEADFKAFLDLFISNLAPNNPFKENIFSPISQVMKNETWYGEDLVSDRMADLPVAEQYDESTDALSKRLGEQLDISPIKINYLLDQYSGGLGDVFLPMMTPEAERASNPLLAPFVDKFTTDSVMKNQSVSDFYTAVDELTVNANASDATTEDLLKSKYINSVSAELSELYKEKRDIQNSNLPNDEKYEAVREVQEEINDVAREGLETYDSVSISGGYATVGDRHYKKNDKGEWQKLSDDQLEKQEEVTSGLGITPSEYWGNKDEYDYAYESPEKYAVARAVGGYDAWKGYSKDLYDIHADKDENGKSINGSRKDKVIDYVNAMDADYGAKIILFKSEYPADDTYDDDIVDYLNSRNDLSYEDIETILKELGAKVDSEGYVTWE